MKERGRTQFFGGADIQQSWEVQKFGREGGAPLLAHPLVENFVPPLRNTLMSVLGLLTVKFLKRVGEGIYFQINKFTECKVKFGKVETKSLMVFNLRKISRPFQGKKYLRTQRNLICNTQEYLTGYKRFKYKYSSVNPKVSVLYFT